MAKKDILKQLQDNLESIHNTYAGGFTKGLKGGKPANLGTFFDFTFGGPEAVKAFQEAATGEMRKLKIPLKDQKKPNERSKWLRAIKEVNLNLQSNVKFNFNLLTWNRNSTTQNPGLYIYETDPGGKFITLRIFKQGSTGIEGTSDKSVRRYAREWRNAVWDTWAKKTSLGLRDEAQKELDVGTVLPATGPGGLPTGGDMATTLQNKFPMAHAEQSTTAVSAFRELEANPPTIKFNNVQFASKDLLKIVKKNMRLNYSQKRSAKAKEAGNYGVSHIIEARLTTPGDNEERTDIGPFKEQIEKDFTELFKANPGKFGGMTLRGSPTDEEQIIDDVLKKVFQIPLTKKGKFDKRYKIVRDNLGVLKGFSTKGRKIPNVKSKNVAGAATVRKKVSLSAPGITGVAAVKKIQDRGSKVNVAKVMMLVNRALGRAVKQNMGRPALINRTGRFADSAELVSLKKTKAGFTGAYSYQLNPYETFENTGDKSWPAGYNPKPLIAKSIRQLAEKQLNGKLILRRV